MAYVARQAPLSMGILQARILEWVAMGTIGVKSRSPALQMDSLPTEPPGKPKNIGVECIPSPADLPDPGIKLEPPALQADSLPAELPGNP